MATVELTATNFDEVTSKDGIVLVETSKGVQPELPLELLKSRTYGSARVSVFAP